MRLVRREDARGVCLVLLRFCDAETAASFYENYNGRPVRLQGPFVTRSTRAATQSAGCLYRGLAMATEAWRYSRHPCTLE
jgi:hypothetical protein